MNAEQLLQYFERIAEAPEAIPRLRRFILDLAVRGKLVEQDSGDEPASELLRRVKEEKTRFGRVGKLFQPRRISPQRGEDLPCEIPGNWEWGRLSDLSLRIHYGFTASADFGLREVRLLRITDIQNNSVDWGSVPGCQITDKEVEQYLLADGDILIARTGGTIGKSFLVKDLPVKAVFASYLIRVQGVQAIDDRYLKLFLESSVYWNQLDDGARGAGQPNVNSQTLGNMAVPLPPLAEQHRIVTKVDELMALCDDLEAAQQKRERRRDRLVAATLHGLNNGTSGEDLRQNARFYFNHLPRLTTRPEHIHQLRQTILNLAVRGRLVPQDSNDEPASILLDRIKTQLPSRTRQPKVKAEPQYPTVDESIAPFTLPNSWTWCRFPELVQPGASP